MTKYIVTYEETLSKSFIVEADNVSIAENMVYNAIKNGTAVLDSSDYCSGDVVSVEESCGQDEWWYDTI